jgi:3-dehydroquinate dehydratase-2
MRILLLNGPNLATLGRREPEIYGTTTLAEIEESCRAHALERGALLESFQSNHEGALIDRLERGDFDAVICNFGALSHTSYALHDALVAAARPAVEVHISDITAREPWRRVSVTAPATGHQVIGHGWRGYLEAIDWILAGASSG